MNRLQRGGKSKRRGTMRRALMSHIRWWLCNLMYAKRGGSASAPLPDLYGESTTLKMDFTPKLRDGESSSIERMLNYACGACFCLFDDFFSPTLEPFRIWKLRTERSHELFINCVDDFPFRSRHGSVTKHSHLSTICKSE
jgi:hypothetical protein